tara:strand:+ start:183 stop:389 length:207 start_codon:yes stop_codon:yes gene_type:complete
MNENKTDPIAPEIVLFGLSFVNFLPLKILPKTKPPISDAIQAKSIEKIIIFKYKKFENRKNVMQNIEI